ncbi:MAG: deoxyribodipyrimidine photo-lyase [Verrucomicrobia bacterium]|nr:deoxyribodipyrimidine photo-lyase [Verrucomicrobiota bacterium]
MSASPVIVWFRRDLRISDNTALHRAASEGAPVVPVFIFDPAILSAPDVGVRRPAYLHACLESLSANLQSIGNHLIVRKGKPEVELLALAKEVGAKKIFYNKDVEPYSRKRDEKVDRVAREHGIETVSCDDLLIHPPGKVQRAAGGPYTVFTPFSRAWLLFPPRDPLPRPKQLTSAKAGKTGAIPPPDRFGLAACDIPLPPAGEKAALDALRLFAAKNLRHYAEKRNYPLADSTSRLSAHLRFGTISPRTVLAEARRVRAEDPKRRQEVDVFIGELIWRDFYKQILWEFPHVANGSFRPEYDRVEWENDREKFALWCEGRTGFPIVDAAMRQLNQTGWMHNRLRMIVASFLTKDLLISWQWGERYFMEKLFDGDMAANNGGWQWAAGTGTDAQPYFRIFNPSSQAEKFDPEGKFIAQYVPEADLLTYPAPMVDHAKQRVRALEMYKKART